VILKLIAQQPNTTCYSTSIQGSERAHVTYLQFHQNKSAVTA